MLVVLDPGHGGRDPGAIGPTGMQEKWATLNITYRAAEWLNKCGVKYVLTRKSDEDVSLQKRCDIANQAGAACFVSIHLNAAENPNARGMEVYYYEGSKEGLLLANLLNMQLYLATYSATYSPSGKIIAVKEADIPATTEAATELNNRGIKAAHYYVLKHTAMPAALVEVAFITNPTEEAWLKNPSNQELAGKAIAKAVCQYLGVNWMEEITAEQAIQWLANKGIISDSDYWRGALKYIKNLDALLVKLCSAFKNIS